MDNIKEGILSKDEIQQKMQDMDDKYKLSLLSEKIKDNYYDFKYKDDEYRIRLLTVRDREELEILKRTKYSQLLRNTDILMEKDLKELYKKRGIDIDAIDTEIKVKVQEKQNIQLKLGEGLSEKKSEQLLESMALNISKLDLDIMTLSIQKKDLLEPSFENLFYMYIEQCIAFLCCEKKVEDKFIRAFNSFDEFLSIEEELLTTVALYSMLINKNI